MYKSKDIFYKFRSGKGKGAAVFPAIARKISEWRVEWYALVLVIVLKS
jgi:hypothetical protein